MKNIAIFASGNGTNAQRIAEYFVNSKNINIVLILSNKEQAFVLERAKNLKIDAVSFTKSEFTEGAKVDTLLSDYNIDFIVLAGFLWLVPDFLIRKFQNKIINIHPALLPAYGGKGMYGSKVHEAVIAAAEKESGITIHYVNNKYDDGQIIFQAKCQIEKDDNADDLAAKIHKLEYEHFPKIIEKLLI